MSDTAVVVRVLTAWGFLGTAILTEGLAVGAGLIWLVWLSVFVAIASLAYIARIFLKLARDS